MLPISRLLIGAGDEQTRNFLQLAFAPHAVSLAFLAPDAPIPDVLRQFPADMLIVDAADPLRLEQCADLRQRPDWQPLPILTLIHAPEESARSDDAFFLPGKPEELVRHVHRRLSARPDVRVETPAGPIFPRKPMLRGFAHEMSNTLTSTMLLLTTAFDDDDDDRHTLCVHNSDHLQRLFERIEPFLPADVRDAVVDDLALIDQHEETLDKTLRLLNTANDRAIARTQQISKYAKLEYLPMQISPLRLDHEFTAVLGHYQQRLEAGGIRVSVSGACAIPFYGHRPHLHSLFEHLLDNACDAFEHLDAVPAEPTIHCAFSTEPATQSICITDTAGGIQPIHLSDVFEPFYTTRPLPHAGLGLCFAVKLMRLYHGSIVLTSPVDGGTRVELRLPLANSA